MLNICEDWNKKEMHSVLVTFIVITFKSLLLGNYPGSIFDTRL